MRNGLVGLALAAGPMVWAQGALDATRRDPVMAAVPPSQAAGGPGPMQFVQMVVALAVVASLLKWGLPTLFRKFGGKLTGSPLGSTIRVEETTTLGSNCLHVVQVRGRTLLIGSTPQTMSCLADLSDEAEALRQEPAFFEAVDAALRHEEPASGSSPAPAYEVVTDETQRAKEALARLQRLAG